MNIISFPHLLFLLLPGSVFCPDDWFCHATKVHSLIILDMDFLREVHVEASRAREKASEVKLRREEQANARREKLKQAYIKKKLEKLKAASSAEQT